MSMFILLTADQARHVQGPSKIENWHVLAPVERQGGVFILGVEVLKDYVHEDHHEYLATLPQMDSEDLDFPPEIAP